MKNNESANTYYHRIFTLWEDDNTPMDERMDKLLRTMKPSISRPRHKPHELQRKTDPDECQTCWMVGHLVWTGEIPEKSSKTRTELHWHARAAAGRATGQDIDNPDIKLLIQWVLLPDFDSMIQRIGRDGRIKRRAPFVLLMPAWTQVAGPDEVHNHLKKPSDATNTCS